MLARRDMSHVIRCSVEDLVQLDNFPHIIWKYYGEDKPSEKDKEEESSEDEMGEHSHTLMTGNCNMIGSQGPEAQGEAIFGAARTLAAGQRAFTQVPNASSSVSTQDSIMVQAGVEVEATNMMICPIPYKMRVEEILEILNENGFGHKFLDVHMPQNKNHKCRNENVGCVFVTLRNNAYVDEFHKLFTGFFLPGSDRPCEVKFANVQGVFPTRWSVIRSTAKRKSGNRKQPLHTKGNFSNTTTIARPEGVILATTICSFQKLNNHGVLAQQSDSRPRVAPR